jgi:DNA ligase D-like protein (predicted ligase)
MLATLSDDPFSDDAWIYERKLDGVRGLAFRHRRRVRLLSRNRQALDATYPELVEALAAQACDDFIVDGEIVAFQGRTTSFSRLQGRMQIQDPDAARRSGIAVYYYLFDVLHLAGHDVTHLPLRARKALLKRALRFRDPLRFTRHRNGAGLDYLRAACRKGWEGLIVKRATSVYAHRRSTDWLKFKCTRGQEFVVGGFTEPRGDRQGFGALLIGYYARGRLRYAGKVGTGYDDRTLRQLGERLARLERKTSPFTADDGLPRKAVHWVTPKLVAQVGFTEWTDDARLRHPRFLGLRRDKRPDAVVRERPAA